MKEAPADAAAITFLVTSVLDRLNVAHVVVGSLASSLHGMPRATNDVDVVAALPLRHVEALVRALDGTFYVDADMIKDAIARRSEFNVIHLATMFKVDVFVAGTDALAESQLARGVLVVADPQRNLTLRVASPEDTVAHKLAWYRHGGEVSDRQWQDAVGVLKVQGARIEVSYLEHAATTLGVSDLLGRARREARGA